jgi:hypothetical protein
MHGNTMRFDLRKNATAKQKDALAASQGSCSVWSAREMRSTKKEERPACNTSTMYGAFSQD